MLPAIIGFGTSALVAGLGRVAGLDREKAYYATVFIVVGSYYVLFAAMAGGTHIVPELILFAVFASAAVLGFRTSMWIVVAGLATHGIFDFLRDGLLAGSGVPAWWPAFCGAFDVGAAAILAAMLRNEPEVKPA